MNPASASRIAARYLSGGMSTYRRLLQEAETASSEAELRAVLEATVADYMWPLTEAASRAGDLAEAQAGGDSEAHAQALQALEKLLDGAEMKEFLNLGAYLWRVPALGRVVGLLEEARDYPDRVRYVDESERGRAPDWGELNASLKSLLRSRSAGVRVADSRFQGIQDQLRQAQTPDQLVGVARNTVLDYQHDLHQAVSLSEDVERLNKEIGTLTDERDAAALALVRALKPAMGAIKTVGRALDKKGVSPVWFDTLYGSVGSNLLTAEDGGVNGTLRGAVAGALRAALSERTGALKMASFQVDYRNHTEPFDTREEAMARAKKVSKSVEPGYEVVVRDDEGNDLAVFKHGKKIG